MPWRLRKSLLCHCGHFAPALHKIVIENDGLHLPGTFIEIWEEPPAAEKQIEIIRVFDGVRTEAHFTPGRFIPFRGAKPPTYVDHEAQSLGRLPGTQNNVHLAMCILTT